MIGVKVKGAKQVVGALGNVAQVAQSQLLRDAMFGAAESLCEEIRARAPVRTGKLKRRIRVSRRKLGHADQRLQVAITQGYIVVDVFYARFLEYGTSRMAARPFVRPVLDERNWTYFGEVGELLWEGIEHFVEAGLEAGAETIEVAESVSLAAGEFAAEAATEEVALAAVELGIEALEVAAIIAL